MTRKAKIESIFPLTFMQKGLLMHHLSTEVDQGYLHVKSILKGKLNITLFQKAWETVSQLHPALRTSIHWEKLDKPVQVTHPTTKLPWEFYNWSNHSPKQQEEKINHLIQKDRESKLNLSQAPLLRFFLIKLEGEKHCLLWSCHHILIDGWSATILLQDAVYFYDSLVAKPDKMPSLKTIPTYKSYLNWIQKQDTQSAKIFWTEALKGLDESTQISKQNNTQISNNQGFISDQVQMSKEESVALRNYAKSQQITLNTLLQSFWGMLLAQYFQKNDLVFWATSGGRSVDLTGIEKMVGMFMAVLPVRLKFQKARVTADWFKYVQDLQMKIRKFEYITPDQILSWQENFEGLELSDILFVFENIPTDQQGFKGQYLTIEDFESGLTSTYPLTLTIKPIEEINFSFKYNTTLVSGHTITWFKENLQSLIQYITQNNNANTLSCFFEAMKPFAGNIYSQSPKINTIHPERYTPPKTDLELQLTKIWEKLLKKQPVGVTDNFFEIGGKSLTAVQLFTLIEKNLQRKLPPSTLLEYPTIESLAKFMQDEKEDKPWSAIVPLRINGSKPPLFCLHAGGGHVFFYRKLAEQLGNDQPVYALQNLGISDVEASKRSIEEMAAHYLEEICKVHPEGPYALLSYCFSNPIAMEIAIKLRAMGKTVSLLAVVDSPPNYLEKKTRLEKVNRMLQLVKKGDLKSLTKTIHWRLIHPIEKKVSTLFKEKQKQHQLTLKNKLDNVAQEYQWKPYEGKITFIRSEQFHNTPEQDYSVDEWRSLAKGGLDIRVVPGGHISLFREPDVIGLAKELKKCLEENHKVFAENV